MNKKYKQLSQHERYAIYYLHNTGFSKREIAERLGRHTSTIFREIKRNSSLISKSYNSIPEEKKHQGLYHYLPDTAQKKRDKRRKTANWRVPLKNIFTFQYVIEKLKMGWSPDIIAGALKREYPYFKPYHISHECIYQFIYTKKGEELGLKYHLTRKHKRRKKKTGRSLQKLQIIPNRRSILERNHLFTKIEKRAEFGHFEGDSILSKRTTFSAIHTEVERKTRFIFARKLQRKTAEDTTIATISIFEQFPKNAVKSTTWDNGSEFTYHEKVTQITGVQIFFAEPYKSWQRGTNEHANGMIRRYFPKGTNFDEITDEEIQQVVDCINNRPRKILNYKTPKECFDEELEKLKTNQK